MCIYCLQILVTNISCTMSKRNGAIKKGRNPPVRLSRQKTSSSATLSLISLVACTISPLLSCDWKLYMVFKIGFNCSKPQ